MIRTKSSIVICAFAAWTGLAFGQGQEKPKTVAPTVLVTVGRPNVWTMEQAHYLLEKNRAHDLGIAAADLGALDANEIVGLRIDALKTLFTAQAQFDQATGAKNSAATSQYKIDSERYNRQRARLDDLASKQAAKAAEVAAAQAQLDSLPAGDPRIPAQTAEVKRLTAEKAALDAESQSISSTLGSEPTLSVTSTVPTDNGTPTAIGANSTFDKLLAGIPGGAAGQPKIQASIKLDNYINLQYEIVAKQLTLLRDSVGPNKRVIFLELPQSIYATQKFKPYPDVPALWGYHLAQTWWQIDKVEIVAPHEDADEQAAPPDATQLQRLRHDCNLLRQKFAAAKDINESCEPYLDSKRELANKEPSRLGNEEHEVHSGWWHYYHPKSGQVSQCPECERLHAELEHMEYLERLERLTDKEEIEKEKRSREEAQKQALKAALKANEDRVCVRCGVLREISNDLRNTDSSLSNDEAEQFAKWILDWKLEKIPADTAPTDCKTGQNNTADDSFRPCSAFALDLIPRQGGLNVAEQHSVSRAYGFAGLFGLLSGFGGKARYERQHDQYDQFVQQEVFASAFGKGESRFGWTFGPLPGTKRLSPGLRTTYAVLVVPAHARTLTLSARGCGYRRRIVPKDPFQPEFAKNDEDCSDTRDFVVEIPSSREGFQVSRVFYKSVPAGQRTTVELIGEFTPQVGVLINGTPLQKVVSLGQPMVEQTAFTIPENAGDKDVKGVFELVGTGKLVLSFVMSASFTGTPQITVVTPSKGAAINSFFLWINTSTKDSDWSKQKRLRDDDVEPMFYPALNIAPMSPEFSSSRPQSILLQIFGQGFKRRAGSTPPKLLLNGDLLSASRSADPPHWRVDFFLENTPGVNATLDDPGPPLAVACTLQPGGAGGKDSQFELRFTGKFMSVKYPPSSKNDNLVITSEALKSSEEWDVNATAGKSLRDAIIVLKGWDAHDFSFCSCSGASRVPSCGGSRKSPYQTPKKPSNSKQ